MATYRDNMLDLLDPAIRVIIFDKFKEWKELYSRIFNLETSTRNAEKESAAAGLSMAALKQEGRGITYDDPIQGYDKTYTHDTFALGFRVTLEMYQDDLFRIIKKLPAGLAKSCRQRVETSSFNIFNRAFNATYTGPDGVVLCSAAHPLLGGGTQSNVSGTSAAYSYTALQAAITAFRKLTDDRANPVVVDPKMILIPPDLEWVDKEIRLSDKKPYTADNEANVVKGEGLQTLISPWLTSTTAWFTLCGKSDHELKFFWRFKPDVESDTDFGTKDLLWSILMRYSVGWSHYMGTWGSPGA